MAGTQQARDRQEAEELQRRRQHEQTVSASEQYYRGLFEGAHDAILIIDPTTEVILDANNRACEVYGRERDALVGLSLIAISKDPQAGAQRVRETLERTHTVNFETIQYHSDGSEMILDVSASIVDFRGRPAILSINRDITMRTRVERDLRRRLELEQALTEIAQRFIAQVDFDQTVGLALADIGRFSGANHAFICEFVEGGSSLQVTHLWDATGVAPPVAAMSSMNLAPMSWAMATLVAGQVIRLDSSSRFPDVATAERRSMDRMHIESLLVLPLHIEQRPVGLIGMDGLAQGSSWTSEDEILLKVSGAIISSALQRKRIMEAGLARQAAEEANRAKSEFLSRMSHELRTPLNAMLGFAQLLKMDDLQVHQAENVEYILQAGQHLLKLINEVLDITRIEQGRLALQSEPVRISEVLRECLDMVRPLAAERGLRLEQQNSIDPQLHVTADRQRLRQVLLNLLGNAVKYNQIGGWVEVSYKFSRRSPTSAGDYRDAAPPPLLRVSVGDSGPGIPSDKLDLLFTPFQRLGAEPGTVEGTGLGLALSRRLIEVMDGAIGVESVAGKGSTFWIELPIAAGSEMLSEEPTAAPLAPDLPGYSGTVLYIEDNPANLDLIERIVRRLPGVRLISAASGAQGRELAARHYPDLILLDLHLPDDTGAALLQHFHSDPETAEIPVVILSADANQQQIDALLTAGARAYLTKPINIQQFLALLEEVLGAEGSLAPGGESAGV